MVGSGAPVSRPQSTNRTFLTDALGSVIAQADETQNLTTTYGYSPFGETAQTGEPSEQPYQYTARENDNTGLYYYRARYYDPQLKRFIAEDPIGLRGGLNTYAYVANNPLNFVDPTGLFTDYVTLARLSHIAHAPASIVARASPYIAWGYLWYELASAFNVAVCNNCFGDLGIWIYERTHAEYSEPPPMFPVPSPQLQPLSCF